MSDGDVLLLTRTHIRAMRIHTHVSKSPSAWALRNCAQCLSVTNHVCIPTQGCTFIPQPCTRALLHKKLHTCHALFLLRRAYGSTKRYKSMDRVVKVNKHTLLGAGGEISDFQYIQVREGPPLISSPARRHHSSSCFR